MISLISPSNVEKNAHSSTLDKPNNHYTEEWANISGPETAVFLYVNDKGHSGRKNG